MEEELIQENPQTNTQYVTEAELRLWGNKMQNDITTAATTAATEVLNNITSTVEGHTSTLNTHTTNISNNTSNISSLKVRLDADETNISSAANTANYAKDKVDNIEANVIPTLATSASVTNLQNTVTGLSNTVSGHTNTLTNVGNNIQDILDVVGNDSDLPYTDITSCVQVLKKAIDLIANDVQYSGPGQSGNIWEDAEYIIPVLTAEVKTSLEVGDADVYGINYTGDAQEFHYTSSDESVATIEWNEDNCEFTVTALKAGSTIITISTDKTENYIAKKFYYRLTVS